MKEKSKKIQKGLYIFILVILFIPLTQHITHFLNEKSLGGYITKVDCPNLSMEKWLSNEFQDNFSNYTNSNFGFRNSFVRLSNQISYSLFSKLRANSVVIGKKEYLYEENYIKEYLGQNFIGEKKIQDKVWKLKKIQDTLASKGIFLFNVIAPGKGSYYPEYIPEKYHPDKKSETNYQAYIKEFKSEKINYVDFNQWFKNMKDTTSNILYPKCGIHWSYYGEFLAADSIIHYIEKKQHVNLTHLKVTEIEKSSPKHRDSDIAKGLNLMFELDNQKLTYPKFTFTQDNVTQKYKLLAVADSFFWGMFNWGFSNRIFDNSQFWYYNNSIYPDSFEKPISVKDVDIIQEVEKNKFIMLMSTDGNLYKYAFGFIDMLYDAYYPSSENKK
ncbi:MAG: hypothetical protein ACEPOW_03755 [Bacteroidales bacterium]